jgi:hypothetical protein
LETESGAGAETQPASNVAASKAVVEKTWR